MVRKLFKNLLNKKEKISPSSQSEKGVSETQEISSKLEKNVQFLNALYSIPENFDVVLRELEYGQGKKAAIFFISSICDTKIIEETVIKPLILSRNSNDKLEDLLTACSITLFQTYKDAINELNKGSTLVFMENDSNVYIINTANFQGRSIEKPENEVVLKGPKESFNEKALTNISLIRKKVKSEKLMVETSIISKTSKNELYILYIKELANDKLVNNIKNRVNALQVNSIQNLSLLEQYIEERPHSLFPSMLYTERPDRAVSFLEDGYIVLLMDNSPASLVLPATFWSFFHTSEDHYLRFLYGNFSRLLRGLALFITLFTSAIYVSVTNYHAEMVPPDLLLAISATREKVPFPAIIEVSLMEIAFELIREAGLRVPSPIGPTIGIVGALILGQAAVQANIVSPIVVIVVALGGLCSFAIGDISMNFAIRLSRFLFILAAGFFGIFGMTALFTIGLYYISSLKSFGVPYLAPLTPKYKASGDTIFRKLLKNEMFRPGYLKPKDIQKKSGES